VSLRRLLREALFAHFALSSCCLVLLRMIDTDTRFFLCLDELAGYSTWLAICLFALFSCCGFKFDFEIPLPEYRYTDTLSLSYHVMSIVTKQVSIFIIAPIQ